MTSYKHSVPGASPRAPGEELPPVVDRILATLRRVIPAERLPVPLHEPRFGGNEWTYVKACLDSTWVSTAGTHVGRFEDAIREVTGARHAIATVNGTAGLHAALLVAGVQRGDEVLIPTLSFIATANAVAYCGAIPHFVDAEAETLGLDPSQLARHLGKIAERRQGACVNRITGAVLRAVVPMHTFGHPARMLELLEVCEAFGLTLVEDAAEALGSTLDGRHAGTFGALGVLSFNGNKIVTTGGGGAILTDDDGLAARARHLTTTGRMPHRWRFLHDCVAFNYRMPNLNAALGCAQLEQLSGFLSSKRALARRYADAFDGVAGLRVVGQPAGCQSNFWLNAILLDSASESARDAILDATNEAGFGTRPVWEPLHRLPMYRDCPRMDLAVAESLERRLINLPSSAGLVDGGEESG